MFTGLLWLLLFLLLSLFHMLGIDYFKDLFEEPIFVYPVTALAFGVAIHLIGSVDRLTSVALEQLLNLLKWLAVLAGSHSGDVQSVALLAEFAQVGVYGRQGHRCALAVAAGRGNGAAAQRCIPRRLDPKPYPRWIGLSLRIVVPLLVLIAATALYALCVRVQHFGLTVSRVWALVVAFAALLYSGGYALSAFGKNAWFAGMARVNIAVALTLIAVIAATFTPLLSPFRLAADSQYRLVVERGLAALESPSERPENRYRIGDQPLKYLRFSAGRYGLQRLEALSRLQTGKDAEQVPGCRGANAGNQQPLEQREAVESPTAALAALTLFPAGSSLDPNLVEAIVADSTARGMMLSGPSAAGFGIFMDLNGDGRDEFVLMMGYAEFVYEKRQDTWHHAGNLTLRNPQQVPRSALLLDLKNSLQQGDFSSSPSAWKNLVIGAHRFEVIPTP